MLDFIGFEGLFHDWAKITYRSVFLLIFAPKRFKIRFKNRNLNLRFFKAFGTFLTQINQIISSDFYTTPSLVTSATASSNPT